MTQYQIYNDPTQYNPTAISSNTRILQEQDAQARQGEQQRYNELVRNNQVAQENTRRAGQELQELSKFSTTLTNFLVGEAEEKNKKDMAEGINEQYMQFTVGAVDTSGYNAGLEVAREQNAAAQDVASGVLDEDGSNYQASSAFSAPTTWREVGRRKGMIMAAAGQYGAWMEQGLAGMDINNPVEYAAARQRLRTQFFAAAGVIGHNPAFLADTLFPAVAKADASQAAKWTKDYNIDQSQQRQDDLTASFLQDRDLGAYLGSMRNELSRNGKKLGWSGAWDQWTERAEEAIRSGTLTGADIDAMAAQVKLDDPKGRTYGEMYGPKFRNLHLLALSARTANYNTHQNDEALGRKMMADDLYNNIISSGDYSEETVKAHMKAWKDKNPGYAVPDKLTGLLLTSVEGEIREEQDKEIQELIQMNLLSLERLSLFDPTLQQKYRNEAISQEKLRKAHNEFKGEMEQLEDMVKVGPKGQPPISASVDGARHWTVARKTLEIQDYFRQRVEHYRVTDNPDPVGAAFKDAQLMFEQTAKTDAFGYVGYDVDPNDVQGARMQAEANMADLNEKLKIPDVLDKPFTIYDQAEIEEVSKGYGKPGWTPGAKATYVAERQGVDPITVINRQRQAMNVPPLPPSPAIEAVTTQMTPEQQRNLNRYMTKDYANVDHNRRALGAPGVFMPEVVPQGFGSTIQQAAQQHGIDPSILAGLLQQESSFSPDVISGQRRSSAGAIGIAQFMPETAAELGVNPLDPIASIEGAARYLKQLLDMFDGDMHKALTAYNGGMGNVQRYGGPIPGNAQNENYANEVLKNSYKYGRKASLSERGVMRPRFLAYTSGNIGPTSTGQHLDVKQVGGGRFEETALDDYVEVDDPKFGTVSLGQIRKLTGNVGDSWDEHAARGSHGIDYGLYEGTKIYLKNGAEVVGTSPTEHGDLVTIQLPNGKQYTFLHGKAPK